VFFFCSNSLLLITNFVHIKFIGLLKIQLVLSQDVRYGEDIVNLICCVTF